MQPTPALALLGAGGASVRGHRLVANWERVLDVTLLSIALLLFSAGFYWLVGA